MSYFHQLLFTYTSIYFRITSYTPIADVSSTRRYVLIIYNK